MERFSLLPPQMTHVTFATIIRRRVPLAPREAAALTLAVAAEWDRHRTPGATSHLPDVGAIRLHSSGDISFHVRVDQAGTGVSLSALLGQLLGIDEPTAPRQRVPGGLLITIAGRLGQVDLPSRTEDGFRAALARFADEDPDVLPRVFRRAARIARAGRHHELRLVQAHGALEGHHPARRPIERRRQPQAMTDLRRDLRQLEQRVFESCPQPRDAAAASFLTRQAGWVAAAVLSVVTAVLIAASGREQPTTSAATPPVRVNIDTAVAAPAPAVQVASGGPLPAPSRVAESRPVHQPVVIRSRPRRSAARKAEARPAHAVAFAGGTRTINWLPSGR